LSKIGIGFLVLALVLMLGVLVATNGDFNRCPADEHKYRVTYFHKTAKTTTTFGSHDECF